MFYTFALLNRYLKYKIICGLADKNVCILQLLSCFYRINECEVYYCVSNKKYYREK